MLIENTYEFYKKRFEDEKDLFLRLLRRVKTALNHVSEMLINHVGLLISNQSLIND